MNLTSGFSIDLSFFKLAGRNFLNFFITFIPNLRRRELTNWQLRFLITLMTLPAAILAHTLQAPVILGFGFIQSYLPTTISFILNALISSEWGSFMFMVGTALATIGVDYSTFGVQKIAKPKFPSFGDLAQSMATTAAAQKSRLKFASKRKGNLTNAQKRQAAKQRRSNRH